MTKTRPEMACAKLLLEQLGFQLILNDVISSNSTEMFSILPVSEFAAYERDKSRGWSSPYFGEWHVRTLVRGDVKHYIELPLGNGDRPEYEHFYDVESFVYALEYLKLRYDVAGVNPEKASEALVIWMQDPYYTFDQLILVSGVPGLTKEEKNKLVHYRLDMDMFNTLADGVPLSLVSEMCNRDLNRLIKTGA